MHVNLKSKGSSEIRAAAITKKRTRVVARGRHVGKTVTIYEAETAPNIRRRPPTRDLQGNLVLGHVTLRNGIRVDHKGIPRSKTYSYAGHR